MNKKRLKWFIDRIGKKVYRNKDNCPCDMCNHVYLNGLTIINDTHASYLYDVEAENNFDGFPLKYFDTIKQRDKFEKNLKNDSSKNIK